LKILLELALVQFYKDVIVSLWSIDNWASRYALFFDNLELSQSEVVEIYKQQIAIENSSLTFYGTT